MDYSNITVTGRPVSPEVAQMLIEWIAAEAIRLSATKTQENLLQNRQRRADFRAGVAESWGETIRALEVLRNHCFEYGSHVNQKISAAANETRQDVSELAKAVIYLHARALATASEIREMIASGHASGAMARWRTMRELNVIAAFLIKHDELGKDVAKRYRDHHWIDALKRFEEMEGDFGQSLDTLTEVRRDELRAKRAALIEEYNQCFATDNGWAADALGIENPKKRITMRMLADDAGTEDKWSVIQSANDAIHVGYRHAYTNPGLPRHREGFMHLAGASDAGLWEPAIHCAVTLGFQTTLLWNLHPNRGAKPQFLIHAQVLATLAIRVADAANRERQALEGQDDSDAGDASSGDLTIADPA